jgi:NAD(P)-dependent dehydrogenase (short-subunit alcohol dehydrogenase family)
MMLAGRGAVVTGAAGNLGQAVVKALTAEGASVLAVVHKAEDQARVVEIASPSGCCQPLVADVTSEEDVAALADAAGMFPGRVDILVNLVGGFRATRTLWEATPADWDRMMSLNARSAFLCCRAFIPGMVKRGRGRIVNITSRAAFSIRPGSAVYTISKAAVATLTAVLREELKGSGVTAVALAPSVIDSQAARESIPSADPDKWVTPDDLAEAIAYLCSDQGGLFSGGVLPAYGAM